MRSLGGERAEGFRRWSWHTSLRRPAAGLFLGYRLEPIKPLCFALPESGACALFSFCGRHVSLRRRRSGFSAWARAAIIAPSQMNTVAQLQGPRWGFEMPARLRRCPAKGFISPFLFTHSHGCGYLGGGVRDAGCGVSDGGLESVVWFVKRRLVPNIAHSTTR